VARRYEQAHGDELSIVGMAGLAGTDSMQRFVDTFDIPFPNTVSENGQLWARFSIAVQGAWFFLNQDGRGEAVPSDLSGEELAARLDDLLAH
jgi:hypothetical protein